jgi:serine/threonine protein kinase
MKFGHYDLLELLGRGGMGEVWKAHDTATDRVVAVKVLLPHFADDEVFQQRFRREAHAAAALQDPHVVPIHNYGVIDGRLYVDMRFIEGHDLHSLIVDGDLEPTRSVHIIEQVAMALESAHSIGLVHRDIKPANVLVGKYDFAYLIDFGIAVVTGQTALTNTGLAVGTWAYMAPERFGTGKSDGRTDIYALACVLFECLTKRSPFPGTDAQQVIVAHLTSDPPRVTAMRPDLPKALDAVIAKGMAKEPDDRFQSAIELAEAARAAVIPRPAPPPPAQFGPPSRGVPSAPPQRPQAQAPRPQQSAPTAMPFKEETTVRQVPIIRPPVPARSTPARQAESPTVNLGTAALGLGVGGTNLVAMRDGRPAVTRKSVLTLYGNRSAEVGVPSENSQLNPSAGPPGLVLSSFVERVGDPVPMVAADGTSHRAEAVLVEALDSLTRTVGGGTPVTITVPSHWSPATVDSLRAALHGRAGLSPERAPATIIPDAGAAIACLSAEPGLPSEGVVVVCDIGGTGTNINLADADAGLALIGETVRHREFSGDFIDQTLLNHIVDVLGREHGDDPAGTAAVASLARLREDCRRAKERLSSEPVAVVSAEMRGRTTEVRLERSDLERLIDQPVHALVDAVDDVLLRHRVPGSSVSAVALVGGGAAIPLVAQHLSEQLGVSVVTTPNPRFANATGAVIAAVRGPGLDAATALSPAADGGATSLAATMNWVGNTPHVTDVPVTRKAPAEAVGSTPYVADVAATRKAPPEQVAALAWSEAPDLDEYTVGIEDYRAAMGHYPPPGNGAGDARPPVEFAADPYAADPYAADPRAVDPNAVDEAAPKPWFRRTPMLFGIAAGALLLTAGGFAAVTLTGDSKPVEPETTSTPSMVKPTAPSTTAPPKTTPTPTTTAPPKTVAPPPPPPPPATTKAPVPTHAPRPTTPYTPPPEPTRESTPEFTPEPTPEQTEPTVPTFPTVPTVPTLPPLFPEITLPPLFPQAPQP